MQSQKGCRANPRALMAGNAILPAFGSNFIDKSCRLYERYGLTWKSPFAWKNREYGKKWRLQAVKADAIVSYEKKAGVVR